MWMDLRTGELVRSSEYLIGIYRVKYDNALEDRWYGICSREFETYFIKVTIHNAEMLATLYG